MGRALVEEAERWAQARRCREMASDAHPDNAVNAAAHRKVRFDEIGLLRCFKKTLE